MRGTVISESPLNILSGGKVYKDVDYLMSDKWEIGDRVEFRSVPGDPSHLLVLEGNKLLHPIPVIDCCVVCHAPHQECNCIPF